MGLLKFFARIGAVGGTARLVAKQYLRYRQMHPDRTDTPDFVVYRLIVINRYAVMPNKQYEDLLISNAPDMQGLAELVKGILILEAGFAENDMNGQLAFMEVIYDELKKKGVTTGDIFGNK